MNNASIDLYNYIEFSTNIKSDFESGLIIDEPKVQNFAVTDIGFS